MKRFVAFLDILGFKDIVENREHTALIELIKTFKSAVDQSNSLHLTKDLNDKVSLVNYITFSDSIVLYTDGMESYDFFRLVHAVKILIGCSLGGGTPLRGSIAHGDFYADKTNNIFVGKALVTAYQNEGKQQWAGAYICDQTIDFILSSYPDILDKLKNYAYLIEYEIPFKSNINMESKNRFAINWANTPLNGPLHLEKLISTGYAFLSTQFDAAYQKVEKDASLTLEDKATQQFYVNTQEVPQDILEKWENTITFYNIVKDKGTCPIMYAKSME